MKKSIKLTSMASATALATLSMSTFTFANSPQNPADLNTATAVAPTIIVDQTTSEELVPIRSIGEEHGFDVDWYNNTKTTILTKDGQEYGAVIDSSFYEVNHDVVSLGTPAQLINGVTYVPVSFGYAIVEDMNGSSEITDNGNSGNGGSGGGYGGGDTTDEGFDFNNPNIDNGFTIDENAGFDFSNPDIDNGYSVDSNSEDSIEVDTGLDVDFTTPVDDGFYVEPNSDDTIDINTGLNTDFSNPNAIDYTTLPAELNQHLPQTKTSI